VQGGLAVQGARGALHGDAETEVELGRWGGVVDVDLAACCGDSSLAVLLEGI
jgi:hypothetical protein